MPNIVKVQGHESETRYGDLLNGQLYRFANRHDDCNVYMKVGTRSFMLKNGDEHPVSQECNVVPLKSGTKVMIIVGQCK